MGLLTFSEVKSIAIIVQRSDMQAHMVLEKELRVLILTFSHQKVVRDTESNLNTAKLEPTPTVTSSHKAMPPSDVTPYEPMGANYF